MKKILIASTALVAAGMMSGTASASEKINLKLGGFSKWWVVGQWNDSNYTARTANGSDINSVDIKGDNEVYFGGSTTLDNGIQVGIDIQLEAGGHTETQAGLTTTGDIIDESYVFVSGGFGKFIVGAKNNGTYLLHVTAPDAAGNWNEGGIMTGNWAVAKPAKVNTLLGGNTTAILTDGDSDGITYVAPTFYGLTFGGSYKPSSSKDDRGITDLKTQTASEIFGAGALYANTFGGVGVKVSGGWATYNLEAAANNNSASNHSTVNEYSTGSQVSYAGFTVGGSYRKQAVDSQLDNLGVKGSGWDAGVQYASGPYAVSLAYFRSSVDSGVANATDNTKTYIGSGEDTVTAYQLSGKYTLGAGVDLLASVGHIKYHDAGETNATGAAGAVASGPSTNNKGWTAMTGLSLAF